MRNVDPVLFLSNFLISCSLQYNYYDKINQTITTPLHFHYHRHYWTRSYQKFYLIDVFLFFCWWEGKRGLVLGQFIPVLPCRLFESAWYSFFYPVPEFQQSLLIWRNVFEIWRLKIDIPSKIYFLRIFDEFFNETITFSFSLDFEKMCERFSKSICKYSHGKFSTFKFCGNYWMFLW